MEIESIKANNAKQMLHPMTAPYMTEARKPMIIARGDGVYVYDIDGNKYLDSQGGLWCVNVGYNRPEMIKAVSEQVATLPYYQTFTDFSNPPAIELSAKIISMLEPENMRKLMFTSGGSDSTESALKLSRQYWKLKGQPEKSKFISLRNAYHGVHMAGTSVTDTGVHKRAFEPVLPGCYQVDSPFLYRNPWSQDPEELGAICAGILEREIQSQGPDMVAAFIAEPVQGAGGVIVPPANYWPLIREVCDRYDVLLIADEVVTGFGRTGNMFGSRGWGVKADIMCFAKGLSSAYVPLGATVLNEKVASAFDLSSPEAMIMHGFTYSGHPVACAAGIASLGIVEREALPENAATVGAYLMEQLKPFEERYKSVGDVRGKGLMLALDLVVDKKTRQSVDPFSGFSNKLAAVAEREGVLVRAVGPKLIISPPLIFTKENVDELVAALVKAFDEVDK
mgnify:CR=1 FL=1